IARRQAEWTLGSRARRLQRRPFQGARMAELGRFSGAGRVCRNSPVQPDARVYPDRAAKCGCVSQVVRWIAAGKDGIGEIGLRRLRNPEYALPSLVMKHFWEINGHPDLSANPWTRDIFPAENSERDAEAGPQRILPPDHSLKLAATQFILRRD